MLGVVFAFFPPSIASLLFGTITVFFIFKLVLKDTNIHAILGRMNAHPQRKEWWESLATPGDGVSTLRRRMKDLTGRVYGKTGHIEGVSALSGYVIGREKQVYVFSILCNDKGKAKVAPNDFQDNICRTIANWGAPAASGRKSKSSQVTMAMRAFRVPFGRQKIWAYSTNTV